MNDAFGRPQSMVVLAGTSEIARAVIRRTAADRCRTVVLAGRPVSVDRAELVAWRPSPAGEGGIDGPAGLIEYTVSRGTYIRALVRDLGAALGTAAYVRALVRMSVGDLRAGEALTWEEAEERAKAGALDARLMDVSRLLGDWPEMIAPPDPHGRRVGRGLSAAGAPDGWTRLVVGLGRPTWGLARIEHGQFSEVIRLTEEVVP